MTLIALRRKTDPWWDLDGVAARRPASAAEWSRHRVLHRRDRLRPDDGRA